MSNPVDYTTGVEITDYSGLRIYPNPVDDVLIIEGIDATGNIEIRIYNLLGEKVYGNTFDSNGYSLKPDLKFLNSGIYNITLKYSNKQTWLNFIKK